MKGNHKRSYPCPALTSRTLNDSCCNSRCTETVVLTTITSHGPTPPEGGTYYHWRGFTRRFKKQHVIPVKILQEEDKEDNEDRFTDIDELDYIRESHSISRNRISLRGIEKLRRNRIFKIKKPKTGYKKIQNPDVEYDLLDVHLEY
ncbi:hypothetical protein AVEN_243581-1 [Araneus ventricosus]|uniref:Uncharacterized protein n=1 Tax=Araneus ventricosus TaxID=182803 RepID=A0A4Y2A5J3_ARAVE|nr:hypothetical protein AVEN_243581-1 [Araneus ventricosus]